MEMDEIGILSEIVIKIEQVKEEHDDCLDEFAWDTIVEQKCVDHAVEQHRNIPERGEASILKSELKEDDEQEELQPPVRVFVDPKEVSEDEGEQEHQLQDPLEMCNGNFPFKSKWFDGGECDTTGTCSGSNPAVGSAVGKCNGVGNRSYCDQGYHPALVYRRVYPSARALRRKHKTEDASDSPRPNNAEHEVCFKRVPENELEVQTMPKGKGIHECCRKSFPERHLMEHMRIHSAVRPHECSICQKGFTKRTDLVRHMLTHSGERSHECSICRKRFKLRGHLVEHMRIHSGERPHSCTFCQKSFIKSHHLVEHMRVHSGERAHKCSVCQKDFTRRTSLVKHMQTHSGDRPHECSVCEKRFFHKSVLINHLRIHSGERPNECSVCRKSFTRRCGLVEHMRIHGGERPHKCSICRKCFTLRSHLVEHMRIHSGERPYECSVCHKNFIKGSHLVKHMRIHSVERAHKYSVCQKDH